MKDDALYTSIETLGGISGRNYLIILFVLLIVIHVVEIFLERNGIIHSDIIFFLMSVFLYGMNIAFHTHDIYYMAVVILFVLIAFSYGLNRCGITLQNWKIKDRYMKGFLLVLAVITILYLGSLLVLRVYLFKTVTFDFGIFVQMFYYMKETLIPYTTCERNELLSHFAVHFSPFYYFILPFYILFPYPVTLIIVQLLAVASGVIPLYLMSRRKKLSPLAVIGICSVYLCYPALRGGLFFDFHENKFLAPLVLWLLYFFDLEKFDRKKIAGITVFTLLILMVKEDAPIYTACIGLFQAVYKKDKRDKIAGLTIMVFSVIYFFVVFHFMGIFGDAGGAITSFGRYKNLMITEYDGIGGLVLNMLKDPAYVMSQLLTTEKLEFLLWMFLPVLFLPLQSRNLATYILLIPLVVLNLLSNYPYQHSIYFQYTYASGTLVIYLSLLELSKRKGIRGKKTGICLLVVSLIMSASCISDRNVYYQDYSLYHEQVDDVWELLKQIPEDASVAASTKFVPVLAERDVIYRFSEGADTDYIVLALDGTDGESNAEMAEEYLQSHYELFGKIEDRVIVLKKL